MIRNLFMYVIDKKNQKVYHPSIMERKIYGRQDFPEDINGSISRKHFEIQMTKRCYYINDLGSKNGTSSNGVMLTQTPTRYTGETALRIGGIYIFITHNTNYTETELLLKLGIIKAPILYKELTSVSLVGYAI